jgi:hypothetical protein
MKPFVPNCFRDPEAVAILREVCEKHDVDESLLRELCGLTDEFAGSGRRHGITENIQGMIDEFLHRQTGDRQADVSE